MKLVDEIKLRDSYIRFLLKHFKIESFCFPDGTLYESEKKVCSHTGDDICNEGYACDDCPKNRIHKSVAKVNKRKAKTIRRAVNIVSNRKRTLQSLSRKEFELLRASGMLWEIYPDAPDVYERVGKTQEIPQFEGTLEQLSKLEE